MRLIHQHDSVVGGFFFDDALLSRRVTTDGSLKDLIKLVVSLRQANGIPTPDTLGQQIEDQICARQPAGKCRMGAGDLIAQTIQVGARMVDKVAGTNLEHKAKTCVKCGQRKVKLNSYR